MVKKIRRRQVKKTMISCLEAQKLIEPYLGGRLMNDELRAFLDHIGDCRECREELEIFHTVYQVLGDESGQKDTIQPLEKTLERSREHLARMRSYRRLKLTVFAAGAFLAALIILGICFPSAPFGPGRISDFFRNIAAGRLYSPEDQWMTESETPSETDITNPHETEEIQQETMAGTEKLISG